MYFATKCPKLIELSLCREMLMFAGQTQTDVMTRPRERQRSEENIQELNQLINETNIAVCVPAALC